MDPNILVTRDLPTLLTLPQEVLDMIVGLAYPRQTKFAIAEMRDWVRAHEDSDNEDSKNNPFSRYTPPYPGSLVDKFMVSKLYFINAVRVFIANQRIMDTQRYCGALSSILPKGGICAAYVTEFDLNAFPASYLFCCDSLQKATVTFSAGSFTLKPWKEHIDEHRFLQDSLVSRFCKARGIKHLTLQFNSQTRIKSSVQQEIWDGNMRRLEALIRSFVLRPKQPSGTRTTSKPAWTPLYERSAVSMFCSRLRDGTYIPSKEDTQAKELISNGPAVTREAYTRMMPLKGKALQYDDVPRSVAELQALVSVDPQVMLEWVEDAKAKIKAVRDLMK